MQALLSRRAVDWLEATAKEENIDCDWQRTSAYIFPENQQQDSLAFLDKELQVGRSHHRAGLAAAAKMCTEQRSTGSSAAPAARI